jgi:hypothetical protein
MVMHDLKNQKMGKSKRVPAEFKEEEEEEVSLQEVGDEDFSQFLDENYKISMMKSKMEGSIAPDSSRVDRTNQL